MHFSTLYNSKMEISETSVIAVLTIHNDQISNVRHVLDPLSMFSPYLGVWRGVGWGAPKGLGHNIRFTA